MSYIVDLVILAVLAVYIFFGVKHGFIKNFLELIGFILSILIAFILNSSVSNLINNYLPIPLSLSKIIAFFSIWLLVDIIYSSVLYIVYRKLPDSLKESKLNKILGFIPAFFKFSIFTLIILIFITALPLVGLDRFKQEVRNSRIGSLFLDKSSVIENSFRGLFGTGISDLANFFTLPPESKKTVALKYKIEELSIDERSEIEMLELLNNERNARGISALVMDESLRELARSHSRDMFEREYFSHYTPEGLSPFDRMRLADIHYIVAGENLALAPNIERAHEGLMESLEHKENILNPDFSRVGIGVIDGGAFGKMFSQEFTN